MRAVFGRATFACVMLLGGLLFMPSIAHAEGPNAIMTPAGYNTNTVPRGDDTMNQVVGLPFTMNWNGTNYTQIYINMNGNCTFGAGYNGYNPTTALSSLGQNIMAPFLADVDTRNTSLGQVTYSNITVGSVPQVGGRSAFLVNWVNVGRYDANAAGNTLTNSFQLAIVDRSDTGAGNFDFIFNYDKITWDIATGLSTTRARAGWGRSSGVGFELPGSGTAQGSTSALLDTSLAATSLIQNDMNDAGQLGRYVWQVRGGVAPNSPPIITAVNRTLEGNVPGGFAGYAESGDVVATDPDGTLVSLTSDCPAILPLGTTPVTWTATDDDGAVTTRVQTVVVGDTTPPVLPVLISSTHVVGSWTTNNVVAVSSSVSSDTCSGVEGASYVWSQNAVSVPDTVLDPSTMGTSTIVLNTMVSENLAAQTFPVALWPSDWTRVLIADAGSPLTYVRSQNVRVMGGYAAELWTDVNNTRRTAGFFKDVDLAGLTSATLSYSDYATGLDAGSDYTRLEYSLNGGTSWVVLRSVDTNAGWTQRSYSLPTGGTVRVRFSASINRTNEYCDWDDISITGVHTSSMNLSNSTSSSSTSTALADGSWYFNIRVLDRAGNWTATTSFGPVRVDRNPPLTTSNTPSSWQNANVSVTLTPTDAGQVASTIWKLDSGANTVYTEPIIVSKEGTSTLLFRSTDAAGNVETTKTATILIDKSSPTIPATITASAISTTSALLTWEASNDAVSGVARYDVYRDGVIVAAGTGTTFTDTGLTPGQMYVYAVRAVDAASNASAQSASVSVDVPFSQLWMSVSVNSILMSGVEPGIATAFADATTVSVGGQGTIAFDLTCSAPDFANVDAMSLTPSFPVGAMMFSTRGQVTAAAKPFSNASVAVDSTAGLVGEWRYDYILDFALEVPLENEPGTYTTIITYTLVPR
ncbi:MAG: hypothetical protein Q7V61_02115 [Actinomycetota bacterium]|nr:hypothetical protein [Actinomycetota bacterium]